MKPNVAVAAFCCVASLLVLATAAQASAVRATLTFDQSATVHPAVDMFACDSQGHFLADQPLVAGIGPQNNFPDVHFVTPQPTTSPSEPPFTTDSPQQFIDDRPDLAREFGYVIEYYGFDYTFSSVGPFSAWSQSPGSGVVVSLAVTDAHGATTTHQFTLSAAARVASVGANPSLNPSIACSGTQTGAPGGGSGQGSNVRVQSRGAGDVVFDCGKARFDYYIDQSRKVGTGDSVCAVVVANRVVKDLRSSVPRWSDLSKAFGSYFLAGFLTAVQHYAPSAAEAALRSWLTSQVKPVNLGKNLLKTLFPEFAAQLARVNFIVTVGEAATLGIFPLFAAYYVTVFDHQDACAGFIVDFHRHFGIPVHYPVLNPRHSTDSALTRLTVQRKSSGLIFSHYKRKDFSVRCNARGQASTDSPRDNNELLSGAHMLVLNGPGF